MSPRHFTAADLAVMPDDGQRYELVRDPLVWRHPALTSDCAIDLGGLFDFG